MRLAPKKKDRIDVGVLPSSTSWTKEARAGRKTWRLASSDSMSFRCWGLSPSGPPAEPVRKDWIAHATSSAATMMVCCGCNSGTDGMELSGCGGECFSCRAWKVASFMGTSVSSELASLTAPLKSPSSSFADTRAARYLRESSGEKRPLLGLGPRPGGGSASSLSCLLTAVPRDL